MKPIDYYSSDESGPEQEAALWVLRQDRGLTAEEQDAFSQWLAENPLHREALAAHRWGWEELDRLAGLQATVHAPPDPDLLQPTRRRAWGRIIRLSRQTQKILWPLAAAAALATGYFMWRPVKEEKMDLAPPSTALAAPIEQRTLEDGSVVELNRGAALVVAYTAQERRITLTRGEANFKVAKNPNRPFIVNAGGVEVRAVGTAFNVRLDNTAVEVLVTEGRVRVDQTIGSTDTVAVPLLEAGNRAVVALSPAAPAPEVESLTPVQVEERLAWQPRLLDFTDAPMRDIVAEFNRRNPVRLVLGSSELADMRLSANFRSDNVEGFVRLMESNFGMQSEWKGETQIVLTRAR
ncbi:MAG: FecR domain-containing protein [Cephaloticoccus sp.]|nr:FecR domain-containing protein [Cephaloticoccus sp.]MCF7759342.1 FecR domain-containing protein [Cephaloticoccus sp.]